MEVSAGICPHSQLTHSLHVMLSGYKGGWRKAKIHKWRCEGKKPGVREAYQCWVPSAASNSEFIYSHLPIQLHLLRAGFWICSEKSTGPMARQCELWSRVFAFLNFQTLFSYVKKEEGWPNLSKISVLKVQGSVNKWWDKNLRLLERSKLRTGL